MKVKLRKPVNWFGPYQLAEVLCFWVKKEIDEYGFDHNPDWVHNFGEKLSNTWLSPFLQWVHDTRQKLPWNKDVVKIDYWDTWSMDHSLSPIILPMLKQLKATKHGYGMIEDEDVPKEMRSIYALPREAYNWDDNAEKRYEWVLDEMIFAFEHMVDDSWEDEFRSGTHDFKSLACEWDAEGKPKLYTFEEGPNHTYVCDYEGINKVNERINNGLRLFGKYFRSLWD